MKCVTCCTFIIFKCVLVSASIKDNPPIGGFPKSSTAGIFIALAIPLTNLPHRNVYVSYNFEANYNIIGSAEDILPGPLHFFLPTKLKEAIDTTPSPNAYWSSLQWPYGSISRNYKRIEPLLSRKTFYRIVNDKLEKAGYQGEPCLLKLICESNYHIVGDYNGLLGSVFHVLFSPSTSEDEDLPMDYYEAEEMGKHHDCLSYEKACPDSILDIISTTVTNYIG